MGGDASRNGAELFEIEANFSAKIVTFRLVGGDASPPSPPLNPPLAHGLYQPSRLRSLLLKVAAERKPSEVFSKLLNRRVIAKKSGDVYLIYACKFVNATLLRHLRLANNKFATRPFFSVLRQEIALNGAQHCQIRPDARLTSHLFFFTTFRQIIIKYS